MPRYVRGKGKGKLQRKKKWKGFDDVYHLSQFLTRTSKKDPIWVKHFKEPASKYKGETPFFHPRSLRAVANKSPHKLAGDVLSELKQQQKGKPVGGGISELISWLGAEATQLTGYNNFVEWVGMGYEHKKIPNEAQIFAKAVCATYLDKGTRPDQLEGMKRLEQYDTDRFSVWEQPNGQYLVSIHGTKLQWGDLYQDLAIAGVGAPMGGPGSLQELLDKFDKEGRTYDLAGHSLSTQYIINSKHKNADKIYLFNSATSPVMDSDYVKELANNKSYTQFINPSDPLTLSTWQQMKDETVENSYVAPYTYSPFAAHSIEQWYPDLENPVAKEADEMVKDEN